MDSNAVAAVTRGLSDYLGATLNQLTVLNEWPSANQVLKFPSLTIFSGQPKFMNRPPEEVSRTTPDANHQVIVTEIIGQYDFKLQLDLWCNNKVSRDVILGQVLTALSPLEEPLGLSLQLSNYFGEWVRFDVDGHNYVDDEAGAQRRERRVKIDLLVNCRAIRQRLAYAMINLESDIGVGFTESDTAKNIEKFKV